MRTGVVFHKQLGDLVLLQPVLAELAEQSGQEVLLFTRPEFSVLEPLFPKTRFRQFRPDFTLDHLECLDDGSRSLKRAISIKSRKRRLLIPVSQRKRWWHRFFFDTVLVLSPVGRYRAFYYQLSTGNEKPAALPALLRPPDTWRPSAAPAPAYTLLHLTSAWMRKSWTPGRWIELAGRLLREDPRCQLVLSAGTKDHERSTAEEVSAALDKETRVVSLAGKTSLAEYLWLVGNASRVITVDGSASHLASAWNIPCLTLFGPTDVGEWHYSRPGQKALAGNSPILADRRAEEISAEEAASATRDLECPVS